MKIYLPFDIESYYKLRVDNVKTKLVNNKKPNIIPKKLPIDIEYDEDLENVILYYPKNKKRKIKIENLSIEVKLDNGCFFVYESLEHLPLDDGNPWNDMYDGFKNNRFIYFTDKLGDIRFSIGKDIRSSQKGELRYPVRTEFFDLAEEIRKKLRTTPVTKKTRRRLEELKVIYDRAILLSKTYLIPQKE